MRTSVHMAEPGPVPECRATTRLRRFDRASYAMLGLDAGSRMCRAGFSILYNRLMRVSRSSSLHAAISGALAERNVLEHDLAARMAAAAGLRNLIAHRYGALDWTRIHDVASHHVQDLLRFCDVAAGVAIDGADKS